MQKRRTAGPGFPPPAGAAGNAMQPQGFDAAVMQKVGAHASIFRDQAHELRAQLEQLLRIVQGVNTIDPSVHLEATTQLLTIERIRRSRW